ncbi:MAG: DinB family protein [Candidatus Planktophila sp.]
MSNELLKTYRHNLDLFITKAKEFDNESANRTITDGQWSGAFVIHHVADGEMHFATRYFNALTIDNPPIIPFNEDVYPTVLNYQGRDWRNSLALIESIGNLVVTALTPISAEQWNSTSIHPELGSVTLTQLITKACEHNLAHAQQLADIKAR